tara:strand:- start:586 stop:975 length:390 start_codon:yes stop_codon:yes gene_type:complete
MEKKEMVESDYDFEVYCRSGEKYDFSMLKYNNVIDGEIRELKANIPYEVIEIQQHIKKYDIDTDRINEVTIIHLQNYATKARIIFRVVAPHALIEYWEMISDKIDSNDTLVIVRKENDEVINCFVKSEE